MMATRLEDPRGLDLTRYVAEPKLDGQRAQIHVAGGRIVACYSRPGRDLLRYRGFAWLGRLAWPVEAAVLDGEAVAGDSQESVQSVFAARNRADGALAFVAFDLLSLGGRLIMSEPWEHRREQLKRLFAGAALERVTLIPFSEDPVGLWDLWVGAGGEGIVLKERHSPYRPGERSPAWRKLKPKLELVAEITGGSGERIAWGDWGEAVKLEVRYTHPRTAKPVEIRQAMRIARGQPFELEVGRLVELVCWGVMPSGMLRHPFLLGEAQAGGPALVG